MNKPKRKRTNPRASQATGKSQTTSRQPSSIAKYLNSRSTRETIESIALAVILAFIFRGYQAEAFVIPTGSMASTLMGRHIDVDCAQCGYRYSSGASSENEDRRSGLIVQTICPICRYPTTLARDSSLLHAGENDPNQDSFNGDRLVVDKVTYLASRPQRWDVIVFKYPYNTKQNYIKRLVGLPGETIRIHNGDVFARQPGDDEFKICRKPPHKLRALLQIVDDTHHLPAQLVEQDGPSRWQQWSVDQPDQRLWTIDRDGNRESHRIEKPPGDEVAWLRYRHLVPKLTVADDKGFYLVPWRYFFPDQRLGELGVFRWETPQADGDLRGQLITDIYAYNDNVMQVGSGDSPAGRQFVLYREPGYHWAGDLAVQCDITVEDDSGELLLELVEGQMRFTCRIDVATGKATLVSQNSDVPFIDDQGKTRTSVSGETPLRGPGDYQLRLANADDQLTLWINERVVEFDHPPEYESPDDLSPRWSKEDPGDAEPVGIGSKNCAVQLHRIRLFRDLYYHALKSPGMQESGIASTDYSQHPEVQRRQAVYRGLIEDFDRQREIDRYLQLRSGGMVSEDAESSVQQIMAEVAENDPFAMLTKVVRHPELWNQTDLFTRRRSVQFQLEEDQYFPMGDNSPSSKDARIWGKTHYVEGKWLIGKAQFVFWPHGWRRPIPFWPNFDRFRFVR